MPYPQYTVGCGALLRKRLIALLPEINAALGELVKSTANPPVVGVFMGNPRTVSTPTLCVASSADDSDQTIGAGELIKTVRFTITLLLPHVGDDLPDQYEIARQVCTDAVTCSLDDSDMMTPGINAGSFGTVRAMMAKRGALVDVWPFLMLDKSTTAEGFMLPWQAQFSLRRH